ncbi:MAG: DCC1-like thiol-disulfide oxidoreductase family protein [Bacteroidota bacterium]|nr:DCC1-like thiol-disulfide oxidoreductase family protein [Bacteroidota bacterium]
MKNRKIVFFDGVCNFCNVAVDFVWKRNKRRNLYYASLQSDIAKKKLLKRGVNDIKLSTIYYDDGRRVYQKSQAIFMILTNLDGALYPLLAKIALIIPRISSDFIYDFISKNRYSIMGKREVCRIPNIEEKEYFLCNSDA